MQHIDFTVNNSLPVAGVVAELVFLSLFPLLLWFLHRRRLAKDALLNRTLKWLLPIPVILAGLASLVAVVAVNSHFAHSSATPADPSFQMVATATVEHDFAVTEVNGQGTVNTDHTTGFAFTARGINGDTNIYSCVVTPTSITKLHAIGVLGHRSDRVDATISCKAPHTSLPKR